MKYLLVLPLVFLASCACPGKEVKQGIVFMDEAVKESAPFWEEGSRFKAEELRKQAESETDETKKSELLAKAKEFDDAGDAAKEMPPTTNKFREWAFE